MCDLTPVIEGPVKFRDGKKVREWDNINSIRMMMMRNVSFFSGRCDTPASPVFRRSQVRQDMLQI